MLNLLKLFKDEETRNAVYAAEDCAAVQKIMNNNGVPITEQDTVNFVEAVKKGSKHLAVNDGKLTKEEMEQITGGGFFSSIRSGLKSAYNFFTYTTVGKAIACVVICTAAGAALAVAGATTALALAGATLAKSGTVLGVRLCLAAAGASRSARPRWGEIC